MSKQGLARMLSPAVAPAYAYPADAGREALRGGEGLTLAVFLPRPVRRLRTAPVTVGARD